MTRSGMEFLYFESGICLEKYGISSVQIVKEPWHPKLCMCPQIWAANTLHSPTPQDTQPNSLFGRNLSLLKMALLCQNKACISPDERFCIVIGHFKVHKIVSKKTKKYTFSRSCDLKLKLIMHAATLQRYKIHSVSLDQW